MSQMATDDGDDERVATLRNLTAEELAALRLVGFRWPRVVAQDENIGCPQGFDVPQEAWFVKPKGRYAARRGPLFRGDYSFNTRIILRGY